MKTLLPIQKGTLQIKKINLILTIATALLLSAFMTGCGEDEADVDPVESLTSGESPIPEYEDEADVDPVESLYKELVGTYDLLKSEASGDGVKLVVEPPEVSGTMTISSDQKIIYKLQVFEVSDFATGSFEIFPDEGIMLIDIEAVDMISRVTYTWDGEILTMVVNFETYVGKYFWRKLNNSVIELQPAEPQLPLETEPPPSAVLVSANPSDGSTIAANSVITLVFSSDPGHVASNAGFVTGAGKTRRLSGPFPVGALNLNITWVNGDGAFSLNYTVIVPDETAPEITGGTIKDGDKDVDPDAIHEGAIVITFNEVVVVENIALQTEDGDDVGWLGASEGNEVWLELVAGGELRNKTTYVIKGKVSDAAGNETEISITFVTR